MPKKASSGKRNRASADDSVVDDVAKQTTTTKRLKQPTPTPKPKNQVHVDELVSHLNDDAGYKQALSKFTSTGTFANLAAFVARERALTDKTVYPPPEDTFSALNMTPLDQVKVVIVGQDPYHGPNQGHGLAFSVRRGVKVPPSLKNIFKELKNDTDVPEFTNIPTHGYLLRWAQQGVLMLNAVLTVRRGEANSHKKKGWETFTDEVIKAVEKESQHPLVFLLWGKPAAEKATKVISKSKGHVIISSSHPSPLGATKTKSPFIGSKCFSRANAALDKFGLGQIDWKLDGPLPNTES